MTKEARFCAECGAEVRSEKSSEYSSKWDSQNTELATKSDVKEDSEVGTEPTGGVEEDEGIDSKLAVTSGIMGVLIGLIVAFAFAEIGGSGFWFLVTVTGVSYYLYDRKDSARSALGSGLYITAIWLILAPILFYLGVMAGANPNTAEGTGQAIGSVLGMVIYGFIGLLLAIVVAAIAYFVNKGAK